MLDFSVIRDNVDYLLWGAYPDGPLGGAALTLLLSMAAGLASALLGIAGGIALTLARGWSARLLVLVLDALRAVPVLMLIFWMYFLLPIVFGIDVPAIGTVVCALALIGGAYLSHALHAGIVAIGRGQWQAGLSLGLSEWLTLRLVVLPQALRMMVPSFINQWISLIKDTSLAYIVGVGELTFLATQVNNRAMVYPTEVFLFVALLYLLICGALELAAAAYTRRYRLAQ
ncbi:amino acid ABC transporter permease [Jeongeupia chitinilytica]|uniref:ABC transporter permease n=1 Tax=Jeongeupia chitinilytica TaxID=1041641 RepID=A0ABQ3GXJ6_9NEIS|nr:amino acid ABC transporter permease [Jeongeupia chitinilytica]GHD58555.1 ABC transporter permease [Jeongeupia chitinilytica]